ncbi:MAG: ATP-binding cassette domain-containing protein [Bacteroidetes bacterium]|nr:ATP-binding cassette domain-containing protein [Bacteroidota bacterium]
MLEVQHLRKDFTRLRAVDDVSFTVEEGRIFGLIGPNGAGKSTTIRMIMDILQPDAGSVRIDGKPMSEDLKNLVGYLPEERGLYRKNKIEHVIAYFGSLKGMSVAEVREAARPLLDHFSLTQYEKRNVEELSKGNQQKLQFIISILHRPRLLVLDELFAGLDPVNQVLMQDALLGLKDDNRAIIFSTHQMEQAEKLCDDLLMIDRGQTVLHGSPSAIKREYGKNALRLEFTGDGNFLRDLPGVRSIDLAGNFAEIELQPDIQTNTIIEALLPRLELHHISRIEPSLHSIFIDIVGINRAENTDDATVTSRPSNRPTVMQHPQLRKQLFSGMIFFLVALLLSLQLRDGATILSVVFILLALSAGGWSFFRLFRLKAQVKRENHIQEEVQP